MEFCTTKKLQSDLRRLHLGQRDHPATSQRPTNQASIQRLFAADKAFDSIKWIVVVFGLSGAFDCAGKHLIGVFELTKKV